MRQITLWCLCGVLILSCTSSSSDSKPDVSEPVDIQPDTKADITPPDASDISASDAEETDVTPSVACPLNERVGGFEISDFNLFAAVVGVVRDGIIPLTILQKQAESGDCVLLKKDNPFCDPPCAAGDLCNHDATCLPYPSNLNIGTVTVTGLKIPVSLEPNIVNDYSDTTLPPEPWDVGDEVTLVAAGADIDGFSLQVEGVEPLVMADKGWTVNEGEPTEIFWEPSSGPGKMFLQLNVDQHGVTPVTLFCEMEDTGSLSIDATLIDQFLAFGVSGFAAGELHRRSVDSVWVEPGCVDLSLYSMIQAQPVVEGHTPCNANEDCPEGQKCNIFINTCIDE